MVVLRLIPTKERGGGGGGGRETTIVEKRDIRGGHNVERVTCGSEKIFCEKKLRGYWCVKYSDLYVKVEF